MTDTNHSRKLAAVLAADVAGYTRLMAEDEPATNDSSDLAHAHPTRP